MNKEFVYGVGFAIFERVMRAIFRAFTEGGEADTLTGNLTFELPAFCSFAFIVGIGADWLSDVNRNHAAPMTLVSLIWILSLLVSGSTKSNRWEFRKLAVAGEYHHWRRLVMAVLVTTMAMSVAPYVYWYDVIGVNLYMITLAGGLFVAAYAGLVRAHALRSLDALKGECRHYLKEIIDTYCTRSPDSGPLLATTPDAYASQSGSAFVAKYHVAASENAAGIECCCLEDQLVARLAFRISLSEGDIRAIVRDSVKSTAHVYYLEYQILAFIVGREPASSKDIVTKSRAAEHLQKYERMRDAVVTAGLLIDLPVN